MEKYGCDGHECLDLPTIPESIGMKNSGTRFNMHLKKNLYLAIAHTLRY
jgi:hypothetical protein